MHIHCIRNATMKISYAGRTLLTDPMLSEPGAFRSFAGIAANPTVALPLPVADILQGVDAVLISHLHPDHFDPAAATLLAKDTPLLCQPDDQPALTAEGFTDLHEVSTTIDWQGIRISRTGGRHGQGEILKKMGKISGFVLEAEGEPTVYWVGDSIWCEEVAEAIATYRPTVIITHSGAATLPGFPPIIMDDEQTLALAAAAPAALLIAIHLEALDHCLLSRKALRAAADRAGISAERLLIPADGERICC